MEKMINNKMLRAFVSNNISIQTSKPENFLDLSEQFNAQHQLVLKQFKCDDVFVIDHSRSHKDTHLILLKDDKTQNFVGGGRINIRTNDAHLPIEKVIRDMFVEFHNEILNLSKNYIIIELSSIWIQQHYRGKGIGQILIFVLTIFSLCVNPHKILAFAAPHTIDYFLKIGFSLDRRWGQEGRIYYPNYNFLSGFMELCVTNERNLSDQFLNAKTLIGRFIHDNKSCLNNDLSSCTHQR